MATQALASNTSHCVRSVLQNSTALAESSPRVELSQHCNGAKLRVASAIVTLTTAYSTYEIIANFGVCCMTDAEHCHDYLSYVSSNPPDT
jgi:hypothetical protein